MEFGMPTLIENKNLSESASLCRELELDFIELNMNLPMYQVEEIGKIQNLKDIAAKYRIGYTIHLDENFDVCNFNSSVIKAWLDTVDRTIHAAKQMKNLS